MENKDVSPIFIASDFFQNKNYDSAKIILTKILESHPRDFSALQLLALVHYVQGQYEQSMLLIERAHEVDPSNLICIENAIRISIKAGRLDSQVYFYKKWIEISPDDVTPYRKLANHYFDIFCYQEVIDLLKDKKFLFHDQADLYVLLGKAYDRLCLFDEAKLSFSEALKMDSENTSALTQMAWIALRDGCYPDFDLILNREFLDIENKKIVFSDLAYLLDFKGFYELSEKILRRILIENPEFIIAKIRLATTLFKKNEIDQSETLLLEILKQDPNNIDALTVLGLIYQRSGKMELSNHCFEQLISLYPNDENAHHRLGLNLLKQSHFMQGWAEWEWRKERVRLLIKNNKKIPFWEGQEIDNKTLLILAEQGIGDEILLASLFHKVINKTKKCIITCTEKILPIMKRSFPQCDVVSNISLFDVSEVDYGIFSGSIPKFYYHTESDFVKQAGYIFPDDKKVKRWKDKLGNKISIGFSWKAAFVPMSDAFDTHHRSIDLDAWLPLFNIADVQYVNLQYGNIFEELKQFNEKNHINLIYDPSINFFDDVDELLACIEACDVVVTVDNSAAHLAAALGKNTILLLPKVANWRWFENRDDSLWYSTVSLIRQTQSEEWGDVIAFCAKKIKNYIVSVG